jgi:endonuclease/exonuclease/phosphatase (EEP) superfamily protein YafD
VSEGSPSVAELDDTGVVDGTSLARGPVWKWVDRVAIGLGVAAAMILLLDAVPRLQLLGRPLVILAALTPNAWLLANVAVVLFVVGRRRALAAVLCVVMMGLGLWTARGNWRSGEVPKVGAPVTLATMNMRCLTAGAEELTQLLRSEAPDAVVLNGIDRPVRAGLLADLGDLYQTAAFTPMPGFSRCGSLVLSRHPMTAWLDGRQHPTATVNAPGFSFELVAVDFPTPTDGITPWVGSFDELTADVAGLADRPVMAVGDFNAVLEHEPIRRLMAETGLRDAVVGSGLGWMPTFPGDGVVPPLVALDHVMVSPGLAASSAWTEPVSGQAHRALFVTVGVEG